MLPGWTFRGSIATSSRAPQQESSDHGLAALLDYAREGDSLVVIGTDLLGRNAAEVMTTIRELGDRGLVLRSLREGIDTPNAAGRIRQAYWQAWLSSNWNSDVSAAKPHEKHAGHAARPSVA